MSRYNYAFIQLFVSVVQTKPKILVIDSLACNILRNVGQENWHQIFLTSLWKQKAAGVWDPIIMNVLMTQKQNVLEILIVIIFMK